MLIISVFAAIGEQKMTQTSVIIMATVNQKGLVSLIYAVMICGRNICGIAVYVIVLKKYKAFHHELIFQAISE